MEFWDIRDSEKAMLKTQGVAFAGGTLEVRVAFNSRRLQQLNVWREGRGGEGRRRGGGERGGIARG